jgi:chromosome segregation ATPase
MNEHAQAIQAIQNTNRTLIQQLQNEAAQHQENNKRLAGHLQRYADLYTRLKSEHDQLKSANNSQEITLATLRSDNKALNEQVRLLMGELHFLFNSAQMLQTGVSTGDSQIRDSTHHLDAIYEDPMAEPKPLFAELSVDLQQAVTSYQAPSEPLVPSAADSEPTLTFDLDAIEADLAQIESTSREAA